MASNSETGHSVNFSNFKLMIDKCTAFGAPYNPSNADLAVAKMTALWTTGDAAHQTLTLAIQNAKGPINQREILFEPADTLVTRTINYYNSTKANAPIKKDAKGLADRFRGFGTAAAKLADGKPDPNAVSTSHLGYVQKGDTFKQLVDLFEADANYAPNEADLDIKVLRTLANAMKALNDNIGTIIAPIATAKITRDKALYAKDTGIVDIQLLVKAYVKGVYGASAPETKMISGIKFRRAKK